MTAKIGLIGAGRFAQYAVLPGIQHARNAELAAFYDQSPIAVREVSEKYPSAAVCSSAAELIQRRDLDLIYVATPSGAHKELVEAIIAAKRHVVCEKPFTSSYKDAAYLADLADKAGLVNAIDHELRYSPVYRGIRERVRDGYLGEIVLASMMFSSDFATNPNYPATYYWGFAAMKSHGGGILRQHMSHFIDLYQFMLGGIDAAGGYCATMIKNKAELVETAGPNGERIISGGAMRPVDTEDAVALAGRLPNGAPAAITATWSAPVHTGTRWTIQGDQGLLLYQSAHGLWGNTLQGARIGETVGDLPVPEEIIPGGDSRSMAPNYLGYLVGAELEDVVRVMGGGSDGLFATFASEAAICKAIETWEGSN